MNRLCRDASVRGGRAMRRRDRFAAARRRGEPLERRRARKPTIRFAAHVERRRRIRPWGDAASVLVILSTARDSRGPRDSHDPRDSRRRRRRRAHRRRGRHPGVQNRHRIAAFAFAFAFALASPRLALPCLALPRGRRAAQLPGVSPACGAAARYRPLGGSATEPLNRRARCAPVQRVTNGAAASGAPRAKRRSRSSATRQFSRAVSRPASSSSTRSPRITLNVTTAPVSEASASGV
ncbi:Uncharacterised protein [Burkholderia pseudomallei]|nr:Uncharacterised protein [Burkholderia pseudomallei]